MASPDAVVSHAAFDALQIGLPSSSWLGFCVFGTPKTSRSKASLWGSRFFYLMKRYCKQVSTPKFYVDSVILVFIPAVRASFYRSSLLD
ncbi:unnamed protein product [Eruca vesicaria subsp. sativa]|uniref:Uncharacterized protein n=1 Tax=Eruca vesicaria subsp. sativa TaxID=29727 RepID=A0ABC8LU10_ERUVS|nr:unnamed protein product [Eruca vesicaria subsp. sativa]